MVSIKPGQAHERAGALRWPIITSSRSLGLLARRQLRARGRRYLGTVAQACDSLAHVLNGTCAAVPVGRVAPMQHGQATISESPARACPQGPQRALQRGAFEHMCAVQHGAVGGVGQCKDRRAPCWTVSGEVVAPPYPTLAAPADFPSPSKHDRYSARAHTATWRALPVHHLCCLCRTAKRHGCPVAVVPSCTVASLQVWRTASLRSGSCARVDGGPMAGLHRHDCCGWPSGTVA